MVEGKAAVKEVKKFLENIKPALTINRIPKKTLDVFKELAKEEFCEDYGFTLKWLMDFYLGALGKGHERAEAMAAEALEQIAELKSNMSEGKEKKVIKTLDGKEKVIK